MAPSSTGCAPVISSPCAPNRPHDLRLRRFPAFSPNAADFLPARSRRGRVALAVPFSEITEATAQRSHLFHPRPATSRDSIQSLF